MSISANWCFPCVFILLKEQNWELEASNTWLNDNTLILVGYFHGSEDPSYLWLSLSSPLPLEIEVTNPHKRERIRVSEHFWICGQIRNQPGSWYMVKGYTSNLWCSRAVSHTVSNLENSIPLITMISHML